MKVIEIGALEAKTRFSEILKQVGRGQIFEITRRGQPVAVLKPSPHHKAPAQIRKHSSSLSSRLKKLRKGVRRGPAVSDLLKESRRFQ